MFGIEIFDAGLFTSIIISFFAGILSFLSPCVLPIVPPYIAYMSGISMSHLSSGKSKTSDTLLPAFGSTSKGNVFSIQLNNVS